MRPTSATTAPSRAAASTSPAPAASAPGAAPPLGAAWGTADPVAFVAASPDRRWMVVCQARRDTNNDGRVRVEVGPQGEARGDAMEGWFLAGPDPGTPIEAFVGADPSGRFVAIVADGHLVLLDTTTHVATLLPADLRDDLASFVHPRVGAFDPTGRRFLYFRAVEGGAKIAVRELATGAETIVDPGAGEPWRADFDPSGDWIVVRVVAADTNGSGRLDWPARAASAPWMRCTAPLPRYTTWERPGDEAVPRVARAIGGAATDAPGLIVPLGDALVMRDPDGALVRAEASGRRTPLAPKACEAKVLHADAARGVVLFTCLDRKRRAEARLVTKSGVKPLGLLLSASPGDHVLEGAPRLAALHPGSDAALVDLDRGETQMLTTGDRVLATASTHALVLRGQALVLHDLREPERVVGAAILPLGHFVRSGAVMVVPPFVVDVAEGRLVGSTAAAPLAVASDGAVLVPSGGDADANHHAVGPLRWIAPEPPARETPASPNGVRAVTPDATPAP